MRSEAEFPKTEVWLQRYESVMAHLRYDQEIFWERFGFMLVAEVAALGFFFGLFLETLKQPELAKMGWVVFVLVMLCAVGGVIVWLFDRLRRITTWWIDRWIKILESTEESAFGEIDVFRNRAAPGSARESALHFMILFGALWAGLAILVLLRWLF